VVIDDSPVPAITKIGPTLVVRLVRPLTHVVVDDFLFAARAVAVAARRRSSETELTSPDSGGSSVTSAHAASASSGSEAEITADFCGPLARAVPAWLLLIAKTTGSACLVNLEVGVDG
jgi:hypothetical protein